MARTGWWSIMARLADYGINLEGLQNTAKVTISGVEFPIAFTMETMEYIADVYGGDYAVFERDMNDMLSRSEGQLSSANLKGADLKIMRALIYSMLRTGGLDESADDVYKFIGMSNDVIVIYAVCMEIFTSQTFQVEDLKKSQKPQDFKSSKTQAKRKRKNKRKKR